MVQASSSGYHGGDFAQITINDIPIVVEANEHNHYRGLHIVIINPSNGKIEAAKVFDTYKTSGRFEEFIAKSVPLNFIVVAACKDDCANGLSEISKQWFASMGS